jgi:hypothetical protein
MRKKQQEKDVKRAEDKKVKRRLLDNKSAMTGEMPHIKQEAETEEEDETNPTTAPESTEQRCQCY